MFLAIFMCLNSQINAFYLQKEAELTLRLETLLSKRRAAAMRVLPDSVDDPTENHVEWSAVEEGFRLLERDLGKLEVYTAHDYLGHVSDKLALAIHRDERRWISQNPEEMGQTFQIGNQRDVPGSPG